MISWRPMTPHDLDAVVALEQGVYSHPWTRGQFHDSLTAGYDAWMLWDDAVLLGYYLAMPVLDEVHLLNLTVAADRQGQGHGRTLLRHMLNVAQLGEAQSVWLEARQGNERALRLYASQGFERVGLRRDYYPMGHGERETAVVMRRLLRDQDHAVD